MLPGSHKRPRPFAASESPAKIRKSGGVGKLGRVEGVGKLGRAEGVGKLGRAEDVGKLGCAEQLSGPADETDFAHRRRHPKQVDGCARCAFSLIRVQLVAGPGSYKHEVNGNRARTAWLQERPARLGSTWGLGCAFCAHYAQLGRPALAGPLRRGPQAGNSKWSRYEIRACSQMASRGIRQHAETMQHRKAARAFFMPDEVQTVLTAADVGDDELFRGGVPQVADWLRCWRACQTPVSFHSAESNGLTENFIHGGARDKTVSRKAFASMVRVMAMALRRRKLLVLTAASSISLALDDRGAYRLIAFRCDDAGSRGVGVSSTEGFVSGLLGVLRRGGSPSTKTLADLDDDYSRAMAMSVVHALERLTVDAVTGLPDAELHRQLCAKVRVGVADGCPSAQKAMKFLATLHMPEMLCVHRDNAHAVAIAVKGPLLADDAFKAWWDDVFGTRHALVPDIKNSEEWSELLLTCQRQVLKRSGEQGGGLDRVIRVMSFAKQRFDSCGTPQMQFCCMLVAIAMLLAYVASDERKESVTRARSRRRLLEMPRQILTAGLSASYSEECIRFIRLFDIADHDPATTWRQVIEFERRCQTLFRDGHVFHAPDEGRTCLQIALEQAQTAEPIYYEDGKVVKLYYKPTVEEAESAAHRLHAVTDAMLDRVRTELTSDKVGILFTAFDLVRWKTAYEHAGEDDLAMQNLQNHARKMFRSWKLDAAVGVEELGCAARKLCRQEKRFLETTPRDNRAVWAGVLHPSFATDLHPGGAFMVLPDMVKVFVSAMDSTCGVERSLGSLKRVLDAHVGPMDEDGHTVAYLMDIHLDGPSSESDLAIRPDTGGMGVGASEMMGVEAALSPTDLTRECARLWLELHGRRFALYATKLGPCQRRPGPKQSRRGTLAAVARSTSVGMASLALADSSAQSLEKLTLLGVPRRIVAQRPGGVNPIPKSKLMTNFLKNTQLKKVMNRLLVSSRNLTKKSDKNPYTVCELNPNRRLRLGTGVRAPGRGGVPSITPDRVGLKVKVVDLCIANLREKDHYFILRPVRTAQRLWNAIRSGNMVVMDNPYGLDADLSETAVMIAMVMIASGAAVLPAKAWTTSTRPRQSAELVHFLASCRLQKYSIFVGADLVRKCPGIWTIAKLIQGFAGSKWHFLSGGAGARDVSWGTLADVRTFLQNMRRVARPHRGVSGPYVAH